jgi:hypothetical protein
MMPLKIAYGMHVEGVGVSFVQNDKARVVKEKKCSYVLGGGSRIQLFQLGGGCWKYC